MKPIQKLGLSLGLAFYSLSLTGQGTQLLRQASLSESEVVFVYANDLWKSPKTGGNAIRLTTNEGYEFSPHFSPNGDYIAFSAQYGGNTDVYLIPAAGGEPQRLTYHSSADIVQGWTPDGMILFRSSRESVPTLSNKLYTIGIEGGLPQAIMASRAAYGEISPDGKYLAYTPITSWDPEWRNYRGGQAMPIWILNRETEELKRTPQTDKERHLDPVWVEDKVYFLSERDYVSNIWSFDMKSEELNQITFHKKFDIKSLDSHAEEIVYEQGGYLHLLNTETGQSAQIEINVAGDMNFAMPRWEDISARSLRNAQLSPSGKQALFEHRGEIFRVAKEKGDWRNLSQSPGVADRYPIYSPKGDKIAWFTDKSGEYALQLADQNGKRLKTIELPNASYFFQPDWSPDGKHLSFTDTHYNIWVVNIETGDAKKVDTDRFAHPNRSMNPIWSPNSKWIAYSKQLTSHFKAIFFYSLDKDQVFQVSDGMADAKSPIWDESGKYLYLLASRDYALNSGWLDMSSYDPESDYGLYAVLLQKNGKAPQMPKIELEEAKSDKDSKKNKKEDSNTKDSSPDVEIEGIQNRIIALNMEEDNYLALVPAPANEVLILKSDKGLSLHKYDLEKAEAKEVMSGLSEIQVSADRKMALIRTGSSWSIAKNGSKAAKDDKLNFRLKMRVEPQAEYQQIFKEAWRFMRDFLYVDNVHGAPWDKVWEWYSPWIKNVKHRTDLNYVVDILSGEVAIGHSYVSGGDMPDLDRVSLGLLGADFQIVDGYYQISRIYNGELWNPELYAPLGQVGMNVSAGDFILAINGQSLGAEDNIFQRMEETTGRTVSLRIADNASGKNARDIVVKPISSERGLRTRSWVESNRRKVDEMSNGEIAYVYVPNTSGAGFQSFNRYYFAQQNRKGVIIDERNNGGGSAADYMIDILSREPWGYFNSKAGDKRPWTTPLAGIWGPKVMLINERAGSGGDLLPYLFKLKKLGPLIGTRTWGGLVGTWDTPRFLDGGRMVAPRGGFFDLDGKWAVEGEGVAPDIEVIQEPSAVNAGRDPQLERGVQEVLNLLEENRFELKPEPAPPIRWKRPDGYDKE